MTTPKEFGMATPTGTDLIQNGDDAITINAVKSAELFTTLISEIWDKGQLPINATLATLTTPGKRRAENSTIARSIVGRPPGVAQPFTVQVTTLSGGSGATLQEVTEWAEDGPKEFHRLSLSGVFQPWQNKGWQRLPLSIGASLNTLFTPGHHRADTSTVARSIIGTPSGTVQPFNVETIEISVGSGVYLQTLTEWSAGGPIVSKRISLSKVYAGWSRADKNDASRVRVTTVGDSLTAGGDVNGSWPAGSSWPEKLGQYLPGVTVTNMGRSGDTSDEVLIRCGAIPVALTIPSGSIPASGAVAVTVAQAVSIRDNRSIGGTLAGVIGTLAHTTAGTWTFTRTTAGTSIPVSGKAWFASANVGLEKDTLTYWAGRNDWGLPTTGVENTQPDHIVANAVRFMEWALHQQKHVLIIGPTTGRLESPTWQNFTDITETRARLKALFPAHYVDAQDYLIDRAMADMGLTPTQADMDAQADRMIPPSLYASGDDIHLSLATAAALAQYLFAPAIIRRGWA